MTTASTIMSIASEVGGARVIDPRTDLGELDLVEVMDECERVFGLFFSERDFERCASIQDVADVIDRMLDDERSFERHAA